MNAAANQVKAIFLAAVERHDVAEWPAFLEVACAGQPELRRRVELLLEAHREAGTGAFDAVGAPAASDNTRGVGEEVGSVIGAYKLLEQIGEGGFGIVFMAEQQQPIRRKVALKVLKPGMDTKQVVARFEAERQALALMDHPNIARVFDGGATVSGRPYFVMELVKGIPITDYCDQAQLTPRQRLELFLPVCQAVQHAHQKGIIHRDLKPSNVLVTLHDGTAMAKVIDFGIAKASGEPLTDKSLFTGFGQLIGTPLYMAPEQAALSNVDVDTRSDIYSLGVLLYELLTGTTPFDKGRLQTVGYDELRRIIREEEPPRPSTRFSTLGEAATTICVQRKSDPRRLSRLMRGELDWIVMKCLEKDRNRRYDTASALAADVQRYLHDEPVQACPPSRWYRLRTTLRRHRLAVVTGATFAAVLIAATAISAWLAVREAQAKALAEGRLEQIDQANALLTSVFQGLDPRGADKLGLDLQEQLAQRVLKAARQLDGDAIGDAPTLARLQYTLGLTLDELGHYPEAVELLRKAHATRTTLDGADDAVTLATASKLGEALMHAGALDEALPLLAQTRERRRDRLGADSPDTLASMHYLAQGYQLAGERKQAQALMEGTVAGRKRVLGAEHPDTLASINDLALAYREDGQPRKAIPLHDDVLQAQQKVLGPNHPHTLTSMQNLALAYQAAGDRTRAVPLYQDALHRRMERLGPAHPDTLGSMLALAEAYRTGPEPAKAVPLLEEALAKARVRLPPGHAVTLTCMNNLAAAYERSGDRTRAIPLYAETMAQRQAKFGADHPATLRVLTNLAVAYAREKQHERAIPLFEEALRLRAAKDGRGHPDTVASLANLGAAYHHASRRAEAGAHLEEAIDLARRLPGGLVAAQMVWLLAELAAVYDEAGQADRAEPLHREFLNIRQQQFGQDDLRTAAALDGLAANLLAQNRFVDAEPLARDCLMVRTRKQPDAWQTYSTRSRVGATLLGQKKYAEARPLLVDGCEGLRQRVATIPPASRLRLVEAVQRLIALYQATGEADRLKELRARDDFKKLLAEVEAANKK
jgi:serine/threonine protein kinase